jgi:hypothetical protein
MARSRRRRVIALDDHHSPCRRDAMSMTKDDRVQRRSVCSSAQPLRHTSQCRRSSFSRQRRGRQRCSPTDRSSSSVRRPQRRSPRRWRSGEALLHGRRSLQQPPGTTASGVQPHSAS